MKLIFDGNTKNEIDDIIARCKTEVGWYGTTKIEDDEIHVTQIIVYPQLVSATRVTTTGYPEYDKFMLELPDDIANNIRFAGHSHVNMAAVPSGIDIADEKVTMESLPGEWYVFYIQNKRGEYDVRIHHPDGSVEEYRSDRKENIA